MDRSDLFLMFYDTVLEQLAAKDIRLINDAVFL